ncbi:hypothetical protein SAMN04488063_0060 [Halopelagius inordinatus]|uniref:Uncharacterized protein n=1 Tax=Halopelagius inordinatus TaxID=553467 RepID=A0A1I2WYK1_9EURY|nr:hypothetical protein SAMN04488063_0060 [Halopelagius inordinatus]
MAHPHTDLLIGTVSLLRPLHGTAAPGPVPHWVVLLVAVPALWLFIGGAVLAADRLLGRLGM